MLNAPGGLLAAIAAGQPAWRPSLLATARDQLGVVLDGRW